MAASVPDVRLNNGVRIPQLGYGVFRVPNEATVHAVRTAIECGYRRSTPPRCTGTRRGSARARDLRGSPRGSVRHDQAVERDQGYETFHALRGEPAAARPGLRRPLPDPLAQARADRYVDTWRALEKLYADGRVRASASPTSAWRTCSGCSTRPDVVPAVNQVELHLDLPQAQLRRVHARAASSPRPGARSGRAGRSADPASSSWPAGTAGPRPRSCSAGTCSSATSSSRSRPRRLGSGRTSQCSISS